MIINQTFEIAEVLVQIDRRVHPLAICLPLSKSVRRVVTKSRHPPPLVGIVTILLGHLHYQE